MRGEASLRVKALSEKRCSPSLAPPCVIVYSLGALIARKSSSPLFLMRVPDSSAQVLVQRVCPPLSGGDDVLVVVALSADKCGLL